MDWILKIVSGQADNCHKMVSEQSSGKNQIHNSHSPSFLWLTSKLRNMSSTTSYKNKYFVTSPHSTTSQICPREYFEAGRKASPQERMRLLHLYSWLLCYTPRYIRTVIIVGVVVAANDHQQKEGGIIVHPSTISMAKEKMASENFLFQFQTCLFLFEFSYSALSQLLNTCTTHSHNLQRPDLTEGLFKGNTPCTDISIGV